MSEWVQCPQCGKDAAHEVGGGEDLEEGLAGIDGPHGL